MPSLRRRLEIAHFSLPGPAAFVLLSLIFHFLSPPLLPCIPILPRSLSTVERDLCDSKLVQNFTTSNISLKSLFESPGRLSARCNRTSPIEEPVLIVFNWDFATHRLYDYYFCAFCTIFP